MEKLNLIKSTSNKIRILTEMYDPEEYPATILKRNESLWLKSVEDAFVDFMAAVFDFELDKSLENKIKEVKMSIRRFVTIYNNKVISVDLEKDALSCSENCSASVLSQNFVTNPDAVDEASRPLEEDLEAVDEAPKASGDLDAVDEATRALDEILEAVEDHEATEAVTEDHDADEEALEVAEEDRKACDDLNAVVETSDAVDEAHDAGAPVVEETLVAVDADDTALGYGVVEGSPEVSEENHGADDDADGVVDDDADGVVDDDAGDVANPVDVVQVDGLILHCNDCDDDSRATDEQVDDEKQVVEDLLDDNEHVHVAGTIAVEQVEEAAVSVTVVDGDADDPEVDVNSDDEQVPVDHVESAEVCDEQVTEADVTHAVLDAGGVDVDENFDDDDDVKIAAEPEPDDVKKVTVNELVTAFSDPIDAEVDPSDDEVDSTEVAVDPIDAEIVPIDAAVVPSGETLRLSLYHRNRTKQGKTVVAREMSDLKSDKVEPFSEGEDVAAEIENPDVENKIEVIHTVLLENADNCDAANLFIDSDAGDVFDKANAAALIFVQLDDDVSNILASLVTSQNQSSIDLINAKKGSPLAKVKWGHSQVS